MDGLQPAPRFVREREGVRVYPSQRPCVDRHGVAWVLDGDRVRPIADGEFVILEDDCGLATFAPVLTGIALHLYDTGAAEVDARGIEPVHARLVPPPEVEAVQAVASDVLAVHTRAPDLLERALLEVLVNAVGHRSFAPAFVDEPVRVDVFTDLVRVTSPGAAPRPVRALDGTIVGRWSRNPKWMAELCSAGLGHQQGRGLAMAPRLARDAGYGFAVRSTLDAVVAELRAEPERWDLPRDRVRQRQPDALRAERILDQLTNADTLSVTELAEALQMPASTVRASLRRLVLDGRVEGTCEAARSPLQRYRLTPTERDGR